MAPRRRWVIFQVGLFVTIPLSMAFLVAPDGCLPTGIIDTTIAIDRTDSLTASVLTNDELKKVDSAVLEALASCPQVRVRVSLTRPANHSTITDLVDSVLYRIAPSDFQEATRPTTLAEFYGKATALGVQTLALQPEVILISLEERRPRKPMAEKDIKVDPRLEEQLRTQPFARVTLTLRDAGAHCADFSIDYAMVAAAKLEDKVLATLSESDFKAPVKLKTVPMIFGDVSAAGLEKLRANPDVVRMTAPRKFRIQD